jgi:MFS-type transporter involved in bile tolerance (Atg22 family)
MTFKKRYLTYSPYKIVILLLSQICIEISEVFYDDILDHFEIGSAHFPPD